MTIFTFLILSLLQNITTTYEFDLSLDNLAMISNSIAQKLIHGIILSHKDSNNYELLTTMIVQDLIENCYTESLEFPIGAMLLKSITLDLI